MHIWKLPTTYYIEDAWRRVTAAPRSLRVGVIESSPFRISQLSSWRLKKSRNSSKKTFPMWGNSVIFRKKAVVVLAAEQKPGIPAAKPFRCAGILSFFRQNQFSSWRLKKSRNPSSTTFPTGGNSVIFLQKSVRAPFSNVCSKIACFSPEIAKRLVYGGLEALRLLEKSLFSECLSDALVFFTFQSANGFISAGAPVRFWADRHISPCFLQFRIISRNTLISVASAARKVVFFKVSARCLCVSSEFLNDSDDFTENDIFQDGSSDI